jgi:cytochrome c peroxidase
MRRFVATSCAGLVLLAGCSERVTSFESTAPPVDAELRRELQLWGIVPIGPLPEQVPAQVALGQALFFDKILSGNRDIACASCHHPETALSDGLSLAIGTGGTGSGEARTLGSGREFLPRRAPSLLNSALGTRFVFWDGRLVRAGPLLVHVEAGPAPPAGLSDALAAQATLPVIDRGEMRGEPGDIDVFGEPNELAEIGDAQHQEIWRAIMRRLMIVPEYLDLFRAAFPEVVTPSHFNFEHAARAIAAFQTEAFTKVDTPFDRYLDGDDTALTAQQKRGALLFLDGERAGCVNCHGGPLLGGGGFANVGVPQIGPGFGRLRFAQRPNASQQVLSLLLTGEQMPEACLMPAIPGDRVPQTVFKIRLRRPPRRAAKPGRVETLVRQLLKPVGGAGLFTQYWSDLTIPMMDGIHLGTTLIFDIGVFLVVAGMVATVLFRLQERPIRKQVNLHLFGKILAVAAQPFQDHAGMLNLLAHVMQQHLP